MTEITPAIRRHHRVAAASFALALSAGTLAGVGTVAAAPSAQAAESTYTVRSGDTLWRIAAANGVALSELMSLNGLSGSSIIYPGDVLRLTGTTTAAPAPTSGGTYTVRAGDGWWVISQRVGMSMSALTSLNGMTTSTMLHPGMVLKTSTAVERTSTTAPAPAPAPKPVRQSSSKRAAIDFMVAKVRSSSTYYAWGGNGPYGYDCSGLVKQAMAQSGITAARTSHDQYVNAPTKVSRANAQPGDLVFWANQSTGRIYHVAMYIGDGKIAHALNPTADLVITDMNIMSSNMLSVVGRY